jgi:triacylglycerol lipase
VECLSFYCPTDTMVVPGWQAVLPLGERRRLPVWTHQQMIRHPRAVDLLARELLRP